VISFQTVFISLAQNTDNQTDNHNAQVSITQNGTQISHVHQIQFFIASFIAASGHIAFAVSFEPCANDSNATANINGILNNQLTNFFLSLKKESFFCL
jgi:hypothetical protein